MKAVGSSLLLAIANGEVRLSAQRLNPLIDDSLGLASILLIRRNGGSGRGQPAMQPVAPPEPWPREVGSPA